MCSIGPESELNTKCVYVIVIAAVHICSFCPHLNVVNCGAVCHCYWWKFPVLTSVDITVIAQSPLESLDCKQLFSNICTSTCFYIWALIHYVLTDSVARISAACCVRLLIYSANSVISGSTDSDSAKANLLQIQSSGPDIHPDNFQNVTGISLSKYMFMMIQF